MKYFNRNITTLFLIAGLLFNMTLSAQSKDSVFHFIFTSDVHFGLTKEDFRGKEDVPSIEVNKAMIQVMNNMIGKQLPDDNGVGANNKIKGIESLVITGDIANRMEKGIQSAADSWKQFQTIYIDSNHLLNNKGKAAGLWVVPGNHDMSNANGFHRPLYPLKDASSMLGIYNLMFPEKKLTHYDSVTTRIHYSKDVYGVHFIFLSLYPDSAERVWMEKDLASVKSTTPVFLFAHSIPDVEARFFENPNGDHSINEEDKFENLVPERYKDGKLVKGPTDIEQLGFVSFVQQHPNIKVYFHGHENYTEYYTYKGPKENIQLTSVRTDSPMKGKYSAKDEKKLAFELVSIDTKNKTMSVREILWNKSTSTILPFTWGQMINISIQ